MSAMLLENYRYELGVLAKYRDLLSVDDLSEIFSVSKNTVYKELKEGKFGTPVKIGRAYKIPKVYVLRNYLCRE